MSSTSRQYSYDAFPSGPGALAVEPGRWRAYTPDQRLRAARRNRMSDKAIHALRLTVAAVVAVIFALKVCGQVEHLVFVWPVSGVLFALAAPRWRRARGLTVSVSAAAVALGTLLVHSPPWLAVQMAVLTAVDLYLAGNFLFPTVSRFADLKRREGVVRFALCAILIPLCTTLMGAPGISLLLHKPLADVVAHCFFSNSLGIALAYPATLLVLRREAGWAPFAHFADRSSLLSIAWFAAVAGWAFWQTSGPFLFVVFPPMIVMLLVLGLEGAVVASLLLSAIGSLATTYGHGPLWLVHGMTNDHRLLILQLFVWICLATAMPVGALLDERQAAERKADEARAIYQTMLQNSEEMIVLSSIEGNQRYVSPAVERITGFTPEEYLARSRAELVHPEDRDLATMTLDSLRHGKWEHTLRYRILQKQGGYKWVEAIVRAYGDRATGSIAGYVGAVRDISELQRTETRWEEERAELAREQQRLADLASTDALTGLPNRRALEELLSNHEFDMRMQSRHAALDGMGALAVRKLTVMMVDVDFFKLYNDTYGHAQGDECLAQLAEILRSTLTRKDDVVARLGGEEFAVVLPGAGTTAARAVAERMLQAVRAAQRIHHASPLGYVTVSIGVAVGEPGCDFSYAHLLQQADRELYASKGAGKNCASVGVSAGVQFIPVAV